MAQQDKNREIAVREEIDDEDELDGWGPVRVRRSTVPSVPPVRASDEDLHTDDDDDGSGTSQNKTMMT